MTVYQVISELEKCYPTPCEACGAGRGEPCNERCPIAVIQASLNKIMK
jgi:hypothetical protein